MATAAIIGGGAIVGGLLAGSGAKKQAEAQVEAAKIQAESAEKARLAAQAQQQIENERAEALFDPALQAQQAQLALLGQGGDEAAQQAAQSVLTSPLVQALNEKNQQAIQAQAASSGISGGNLLAALQDANTATLFQAGFEGLGQVAGQQQSGALGFGGLAQGALGLSNQAQFEQGQAQGQAVTAQGTVNAMPYLTGAGIVNNLTSLGSFAAGGGLGAGAQNFMRNPFSAGQALPAPTVGGGGTLQAQPMNRQPLTL